MMASPKCTYCAERVAVAYIGRDLICASCYRKHEAAKANVMATPKKEPVPMTRTWTPTFMTPNGERQRKLDGPTHVQTSNPIVRKPVSPSLSNPEEATL